MKIALLGPIAWRTPPLHYGPWELITSLLAEGLTARGVDVTLFATLDSVTKATLDGVVPTGYEESDEIDGRVWEAIHVSHALERSAEFDLIHNHLDWLPLAFSGHCRTTMLTTVHGFSGRNILPAYRRARSHFVSISDSDRSPDLDYLATVYHGVDLAGLPFHAAGGEDLILFGRIHPDKGTDIAIEIARRAGRRLVMCGIVQDRDYFAERVEPLIDGDRVVYLGSIGPEERDTILGSGAALLHPIRFAEPFGLSVVESMACGTPVVAYRRGSMPEVVDEGVTGRLVDTVDEAVAAVERIGEIDRAACSARARERFSAERMVDDYLAIYRKIIS
ncbi:glycosyl transferase [Actinoplanes italicus]|uniref:Glycosyltransferase involved in cell wall biosynthesis n=1 Tax=Actinoplanes italicus TaxID=113567 RepID=A0A2T0K6F4_9ACTN|nr:glycosyltransferase family 4 protein [Actinoplanes italicus]PRX18575.1 glycosyltransferase involved in cell wall biosynthesis [Actinoplanes italicus]GIE32913.1 glycosyl transferase [Actinoplanes italicus]